jgi:hypothetical protein
MTIKALYPTARPALDLDFANTRRLDPRITFSRASTATFVGSNGLIQTAASGAARFDHNPATRESLGLLVEEARTNYASQSFVALNATLISSNDTTYQPLQGGSVYKFSIGSSGLQFYVPLFNAPGYSSVGLVDTLTFYLRSDSPVTITCDYNGTPAASGIYFSNGTTAGYNYTVTQFASVLGFTRYTITYTSSSVNGNNLSRAQINVSGTTGTNFYVFGAQWESRVSFPTSYIPTSGSAVTRAADVASMTGTNFSSWYRQDEGTIFANITRQSPTTMGSGYFYSFYNAAGTSNDEITAYQNSPYTVFYTRSLAGGQNQVAPLQVFSTTKSAFGYKPSNSSAYFNNISAGSITNSNSVLNINAFKLGTTFNNAGAINGTISRLAYYPVRLPDAQLQALTST